VSRNTRESLSAAYELDVDVDEDVDVGDVDTDDVDEGADEERRSCLTCSLVRCVLGENRANVGRHRFNSRFKNKVVVDEDRCVVSRAVSSRLDQKTKESNNDEVSGPISMYIMKTSYTNEWSNGEVLRECITFPAKILF